MNKEEITYKIPNNQIHISEIKDEDCLIWISPKALYMANTIDKLQHQNRKYKEVIDKAIKLLGNYRHYSTPDEKQNSENEDLVNKAFDILKEVE